MRLLDSVVCPLRQRVKLIIRRAISEHGAATSKGGASSEQRVHVLCEGWTRPLSVVLLMVRLIVPPSIDISYLLYSYILRWRCRIPSGIINMTLFGRFSSGSFSGNRQHIVNKAHLLLDMAASGMASQKYGARVKLKSGADL